jgi:ribosomal-protein-alanine N-acetyltransferase
VYSLRPYRREDFPQLLELDQVCFPEGISYDRLELSHFISRPNALTVIAEEEGKLAGFILVNRARDKAGHVITIDVHPQHRRHGLGTQLMEEAEKQLKADAAPGIYLEVAVDNKPAIHFYKRHGYSVIKTIPRYYLNSIDALLMTKKL